MSVLRGEEDIMTECLKEKEIMRNRGSKKHGLGRKEWTWNILEGFEVTEVKQRREETENGMQEE